MMNIIWAAMIIAAAVFGILNGKSQEVSTAFLEGGGEAVKLILTTGGAMCLWGGMMEIAEEAKLTEHLARLFSPVIRFIMPRLPKGSKAERFITMNITANLLGLGNAATPLGISAMRELRSLSNSGDRATPEMTAFVVLNSASLQLLPSTLAVMRLEAGSKAPLDILPCVWTVSVLSLLAGMTVYFLFGKSSYKRQDRL